MLSPNTLLIDVVNHETASGRIFVQVELRYQRGDGKVHTLRVDPGSFTPTTMENLVAAIQDAQEQQRIQDLAWKHEMEQRKPRKNFGEQEMRVTGKTARKKLSPGGIPTNVGNPSPKGKGKGA